MITSCAKRKNRLLFWSAVIAGAFILFGVLGAVQPAAGQAVPTGEATFTATEDTYVKESSPSSSYGQRSSLEADNAPSVKRILLRFNVSGIPAGATVTSATVRLYVTSASVQAGALHEVSGAWRSRTPRTRAVR